MGKIWEDESVQLLIKTIRKHEHFWNTKHPRYTVSKRIRHEYWKEITESFNENTGKFKLKAVDLCSKWNNLRVWFERETKRVSDSGSKCSRWKYYNMLKFLMDHPMKKREIILPTHKQYSLRISRLKRETVNSDETEEVSVGSMSPMNDQKIVESSIPGINTIIPLDIQGRQGLESCFGEYVAAEMRHLELDLQMRAKKAIFETLMELQFEQERRNVCSQV